MPVCLEAILWTEILASSRSPKEELDMTNGANTRDDWFSTIYFSLQNAKFSIIKFSKHGLRRVQEIDVEICLDLFHRVATSSHWITTFVSSTKLLCLRHEFSTNNRLKWTGMMPTSISTQCRLDHGEAESRQTITEIESINLSKKQVTNRWPHWWILL